ncbi:unnamed protein product [Urochloa humidicola]
MQRKASVLGCSSDHTLPDHAGRQSRRPLGHGRTTAAPNRRPLGHGRTTAAPDRRPLGHGRTTAAPSRGLALQGLAAPPGRACRRGGAAGRWGLAAPVDGAARPSLAGRQQACSLATTAAACSIKNEEEGNELVATNSIENAKKEVNQLSNKEMNSVKNEEANRLGSNKMSKSKNPQINKSTKSMKVPMKISRCRRGPTAVPPSSPLNPLQ